jgi:hypothetical protein
MEYAITEPVFRRKEFRLSLLLTLLPGLDPGIRGALPLPACPHPSLPRERGRVREGERAGVSGQCRRGKPTVLSALAAGALCSFFIAASALGQAIPGKELHLTNTRKMPFCEIEVATGNPPEIRVNFNNTSGASDCPPDKFDAINPQQLAQQLHADRVVLNPRRHWMMDELWSYGIGETKDFDGVKATWMGAAPLADFEKAAGKPYAPLETNRASKYLYEKGKPVFLLVPPDGKTVFVMQSYTDHVEKGLSMDKLAQLGSMLALPAGWSFKTEELDRELTIAPPPPSYTAHTVVDNFGNVYAGCGFDAACNYVP